MISHITAAAGAKDGNFFGREHVGCIAATSERVNVRMLDKNQNVRKRLSLLPRDELFLEFQRGQVIHLAQVFVKQFRHRLTYS